MNAKLLTTLALAAALGLAGASQAAAHCGSCDHEKGAAPAATGKKVAMDHGSMSGHDMKKMEGEGGQGTAFRVAKVDGFRLEYQLLEMKPMAGMKMKSHHLMTYVFAADGKAVVDAKVGYLVVGAGGAEQKEMAMAMGGGFGADVDLSAAAPSKVTVKVVVGPKTLVDEFTYPLPKK